MERYYHYLQQFPVVNGERFVTVLVSVALLAIGFATLPPLAGWAWDRIVASARGALWHSEAGQRVAWWIIQRCVKKVLR